MIPTAPQSASLSANRPVGSASLAGSALAPISAGTDFALLGGTGTIPAQGDPASFAAHLQASAAPGMAGAKAGLPVGPQTALAGSALPAPALGLVPASTLAGPLAAVDLPASPLPATSVLASSAPAASGPAASLPVILPPVNTGLIAAVPPSKPVPTPTADAAFVAGSDVAPQRASDRLGLPANTALLVAETGKNLPQAGEILPPPVTPYRAVTPDRAMSGDGAQTAAGSATPVMPPAPAPLTPPVTPPIAALITPSAASTVAAPAHLIASPAPGVPLAPLPDAGLAPVVPADPAPMSRAAQEEGARAPFSPAGALTSAVQALQAFPRPASEAGLSPGPYNPAPSLQLPQSAANAPVVDAIRMGGAMPVIDGLPMPSAAVDAAQASVLLQTPDTAAAAAIPAFGTADAALRTGEDQGPLPTPRAGGSALPPVSSIGVVPAAAIALPSVPPVSELQPAPSNVAAPDPERPERAPVIVADPVIAPITVQPSASSAHALQAPGQLPPTTQPGQLAPAPFIASPVQAGAPLAATALSAQALVSDQAGAFAPPAMVNGGVDPSPEVQSHSATLETPVVEPRAQSISQPVDPSAQQASLGRVTPPVAIGNLPTAPALPGGPSPLVAQPAEPSALHPTVPFPPVPQAWTPIAVTPVAKTAHAGQGQPLPPLPGRGAGPVAGQSAPLATLIGADAPAPDLPSDPLADQAPAQPQSALSQMPAASASAMTQVAAASPSQPSAQPAPLQPSTLQPTPSQPLAPSQAPPPAGAVDQIVQQIADAREAGRSLRPELTVRHTDFGTVGMRIEAGAGARVSDWRVTLSARDPGFVPAVHAAFAERALTSVNESAAALNNSAQGGSSQRGQEQGANTSSQQGQAQNNGGFAAGSSGQDQRYGSSPGSGQGPAKPYSGEEDESGSSRAAAQSGDPGPAPADNAQGGALFA